MFGSCRRAFPVTLLRAAIFLLCAAESRGGPLHSVAEIRRLSPAQLASRPEVSLTGVVTYCEPAWFLTFIQDETGGIYLGTSPTSRLKPGDRVQVDGVAREGRISAIVTGRVHSEPDIHLLGHGELPMPAEADASRLSDDTYDACWISVRGVVRSVARANDRASIVMEVNGKPFTTLVRGPFDDRNLPRYLLDATVAANGVFGRPGERSGVDASTVLYVPGVREFVLDPQNLDSRFAAAALSYSGLFHASGKVRVRGVVTHAQPGSGFFMRVLDGDYLSGSVWVQTSQPIELPVGRRVDVAASLQTSNLKPWLQDAVVRAIGDDPPPPPLARTPEEMAGEDDHGSLIALDGVVVEQRQGLREDSLILLSDAVALCVRFAADGGERLPSYQKGSRLRVVGTAVLHSPPASESEALPFSFQVWVRDAHDITLISRPSWWTMRKVLIMLGTALAAAAAAMVWIAALRRRVAAQTAAIRRHVERETLQEERVRMAREFHDTFEQNLLGLGLTLQTAQTDAEVTPRVRELLREAAEMARHTRSEARHAIWELRTGGAAARDLVSMLRTELGASAHAAGVELRIETGGTVRPLPAVVQNHLFRIAQESFTNAIKHAGARRIAIRLDFTGGGLTLAVMDDGAGFETDRLACSPTGSFGIEGMRERAVRMHGGFEISSAPGKGATVRVSIPLSSSAV